MFLKHILFFYFCMYIWKIKSHLIRHCVSSSEKRDELFFMKWIFFRQMELFRQMNLVQSLKLLHSLFHLVEVLKAQNGRCISQEYCVQSPLSMWLLTKLYDKYFIEMIVLLTL